MKAEAGAFKLAAAYLLGRPTKIHPPRIDAK
jgi:hypothetical protein